MRKGVSVAEKPISFLLYACAKEMVRTYQPLLEPLNLTYTQYLVMRVLWKHRELNVKTLGEHVYLDSGTLTPLLRKMEAKGFLTRRRSKEDERAVLITITDDGLALEERVAEVPSQVASMMSISEAEERTLRRVLCKILGRLTGLEHRL
ncbi:MAG: MarR family transcriptional regulator [Veillonella sp.]|nr:MarR family transcriptional regulator [Veillonella sp.]MBP9625118.1 MarR family transcriptional regulator [Veillonella sp.]